MECIYELKSQNLADKKAVDEFTKDVMELTDDSKFHSIILDMIKVKSAGSFCIGTIVGAFKAMDSKGGRLILRNVDSKIKKTFDVFGLSSFITIES